MNSDNDKKDGASQDNSSQQNAQQPKLLVPKRKQQKKSEELKDTSTDKLATVKTGNNSEELYDDTETDWLDKVDATEESKDKPKAFAKHADENSLSIDFLKNAPDDEDVSLDSYNKVMYKHQEKLKKQQEKDSQKTVANKTTRIADVNNLESEMDKTTVESLSELEDEAAQLLKKKQQPKKFLYLVLAAVSVILIGGAYIFMNYITYLDKESEAETRRRARVARKKRSQKKKQAVPEKKKLISPDELFKKGEFNKALAGFVKLYETEDDPDYLLKVAACYQGLKEPDKAADFYGKAFNAGAGTLADYLAFTEIEMNNKHYKSVINVLRKSSDEIRKDDDIVLLLAEALFFSGDMQEALFEYDKIVAKKLTLPQMRRHAKVLEQAGRKEDAVNKYAGAGRIYRDIASYHDALRLCRSPKNKMTILRQAIADMKRMDQNSNSLEFELSQELIQHGELKEAKTLLKSISSAGFSDKQSKLFLKLLVNVGIEHRVASVLKRIMASHPENAELHRNIQDLLMVNGLGNVAEKSYQRWYRGKHKDAVRSFLYGRSLGKAKSAKIYYNKALRLQPELLEALYAQGEYFFNGKNYQLAFNNFKKCVKLQPENERFQFAYALSRLYKGNVMDAIKDYRGFLKKSKVGRVEQIEKILALLQQVPSKNANEMRARILREAASLKGAELLLKQHKIADKLVQGKIAAGDFAKINDPTDKMYYILYLISNKKEGKAVSLDTSDAPNAAFWQCLVRWLNGYANWQQKARALAVNEQLKPVYKIALNIMLERIQDGEQLFYQLQPNDWPLIYFVMAEQYRKAGNELKARILFIKALKNKQVPFYHVLKMYYNKK